jgi:serine/threonine protein kinase
VRVDALKFVKHLGKGGFGVVNLCYDELTHKEVAVKTLAFHDSNMMKKEVEALSSLNHKHIVSLLEAFPKPEQN